MTGRAQFSPSASSLATVDLPPRADIPGIGAAREVCAISCRRQLKADWHAKLQQATRRQGAGGPRSAASFSRRPSGALLISSSRPLPALVPWSARDRGQRRRPAPARHRRPASARRRGRRISQWSAVGAPIAHQGSGCSRWARCSPRATGRACVRPSEKPGCATPTSCRCPISRTGLFNYPCTVRAGLSELVVDADAGDVDVKIGGRMVRGGKAGKCSTRNIATGGDPAEINV